MGRTFTKHGDPRPPQWLTPGWNTPTGPEWLPEEAIIYSDIANGHYYVEGTGVIEGYVAFIAAAEALLIINTPKTMVISKNIPTEAGLIGGFGIEGDYGIYGFNKTIGFHSEIEMYGPDSDNYATAENTVQLGNNVLVIAWDDTGASMSLNGGPVATATVTGGSPLDDLTDVSLPQHDTLIFYPTKIADADLPGLSNV